MDNFGQRIKKLREMRGYTQKALAQKAGIHEMTIQFYEYGTRNPKPEQLQKLAEALEVDIAFLRPACIDTPMALYALLFDLVEEYGDIVFENKGGTVLFGIDHFTHSRDNFKLVDAMNAHKKMTPDEFRQWLIDYPPKVHNGKIED